MLESKRINHRGHRGKLQSNPHSGNGESGKRGIGEKAKKTLLLFAVSPILRFTVSPFPVSDVEFVRGC